MTSDTMKNAASETPAGHVSRLTLQAPRFTRYVSRFTFRVSAFTLVELLVVMAVIGILAALIVPVAGAVKRRQYIYNARAEMGQLETAIDRYKADYGFYPPDSQLVPATVGQPQVNQLYYELTGTTNWDAQNPDYHSLIDPSVPNLNAAQVNTAFGVGGFMNCSKPGSGEDSKVARNFLPDLKPNQVWLPPSYTNNGVPVILLVTSVGGPDQIYKPLGVSDRNPWRYNSSNPTNNPGSYDLYVLLAMGGKTNLICNWSKSIQINSPLP